MYTFTSACKKILNNFRSNHFDFVLDTEFGIICVKQITECFNQMDPVTVVSWADAQEDLDLPEVTEKEDAEIDYFVKIGNAHIRTYPAEIHILETMIKVMFISMIGEVPEENLIDAMIKMYMDSHNKNFPSFKMQLDEFLKMNTDVIMQKVEIVRIMADKIITTRKAAAIATEQLVKDIIEQSGMLIMAPKFKEEHYMIFLAGCMHYLKTHPLSSMRMTKEAFCNIAFI